MKTIEFEEETNQITRFRMKKRKHVLRKMIV